MDEKSTGEPIPISTQKSLSSCHDHGWNDPPKSVYARSLNASGTPPKRALNKRVAFPLSSTPPTSNFDPYQPLSPPPKDMPPPPTSSSSMVANVPVVESSTAENYEKIPLSEVIENLEIVILENKESESKINEVRRRLKIMETAWNEEKLNDSIRRKVFQISKALKEKDVELADKIHVTLMMEHATLCSSWISGIRHVILSLKEASTPASSNTTKNVTTPYFLPTEPQP